MSNNQQKLMTVERQDHPHGRGWNRFVHLWFYLYVGYSLAAVAVAMSASLSMTDAKTLVLGGILAIALIIRSSRLIRSIRS